jgi:hypothetical protein
MAPEFAEFEARMWQTLADAVARIEETAKHNTNGKRTYVPQVGEITSECIRSRVSVAQGMQCWRKTNIEQRLFEATFKFQISRNGL